VAKGGEIRGLNEAIANLDVGGLAWQRVVGAAGRAMIENVEDLVGRAQRDAPIEEGTLRASGDAQVFVGGRKVGGGGIGFGPGETIKTSAGHPVGEEAVGAEMLRARGKQAIAGVVGFNTPYALVQHERLDYRHPMGGKAKYLEDNLKEQSSKYSDNLKQRVGEALE